MLRLIKELNPAGLVVNANAIGTPQIYQAFLDMSDPDDPRLYGKHVEAFIAWAGLTGGDVTSDIQLRAKTFSADFPATLSAVTALDWANGHSLYATIANGASGTNCPIIAGDGTTNFIANYPNGGGSGMFSLSTSGGMLLPLQRYLAVQVVRLSGGLITAGTITLNKIRVYDD